MRTISREVAESSSLMAALTPQRLRAELLTVDASSSQAYLLGALHDATISRLHGTVRFGQSDTDWLDVLSVLLEKIGRRSWMYREGRNRRFWVLETSSRWINEPFAFGSDEEQLAYARGYFDAEGGIPRDPRSRFYIQFVQKNHSDLAQLREMLIALGIKCGELHNPSRRVDPDMWRFYVLSGSHAAFVHRVGSWNLRKRRRLEAWTASRSG
jgi:hypothetical protein